MRSHEITFISQLLTMRIHIKRTDSKVFLNIYEHKRIFSFLPIHEDLDLID
jgi:hypothetical protein